MSGLDRIGMAGLLLREPEGIARIESGLVMGCISHALRWAPTRALGEESNDPKVTAGRLAWMAADVSSMLALLGATEQVL